MASICDVLCVVLRHLIDDLMKIDRPCLNIHLKLVELLGEFARFSLVLIKWSFNIGVWMFEIFWIKQIKSPNLSWPPCSPDLTLMDFFLWGYIKSCLYTTPMRDLGELRERILAALQSLTAETIARVIVSYQCRLWYFIEVRGRKNM